MSSRFGEGDCRGSAMPLPVRPPEPFRYGAREGSGAPAFAGVTDHGESLGLLIQHLELRFRGCAVVDRRHVFRAGGEHHEGVDPGAEHHIGVQSTSVTGIPLAELGLPILLCQ